MSGYWLLANKAARPWILIEGLGIFVMIVYERFSEQRTDMSQIFGLLRRKCL